MSKLMRAILAGAFAASLAASPAAFADDENATQTNSGPPGQVTHDKHFTEHTPGPTATPAPTQTNSGAPGQVAHDKHFTEHTPGPTTVPAPTQTNSGPARP